jgi:phospholipid/cholesterol/gamma-HCH transport system substrate-binding protein
MKRTVGVRWGSLSVGIVLMVAIAVALWASLSGGGTSIFERKEQFVCYFKNVNGLVRGSPVWMSGVEVGNVRSVSFVNLDSLRQVRVVCRVKKSVWPMLTEDAEVMLGTIGLVGDKYVEIIPGTKGKSVINKMDVIATRDAGDALAMFKAGEEAIDEARSVVDNLDTLLAGMNRGEGTLGQLATDDQLYHELTKLASQLTRLTANLQQNQERIVSSMEKTATTVERLSEQVSSNTGTIGKLVNDPQLYDNLSATSARLDTILYKLNTAEGSLGLLVSDTALYVEMTNLLARINNLVTDIEKNPRKYFKFSIF